MSVCECGAHYMQNCSWWCGLSQEEKNKGWEMRNPRIVTIRLLKELIEEVESLKSIIKNRDINPLPDKSNYNQ